MYIAIVSGTQKPLNGYPVTIISELIIPIKVSEAFLAMREIIANAKLFTLNVILESAETETDCKITKNRQIREIFAKK
ncbi:MAG: hypothetical protein J6X70_02570 [Muribaculaceae bacterium]|nr:hypothetical protein [Muribaculaceae bacterium]